MRLASEATESLTSDAELDMLGDEMLDDALNAELGATDDAAEPSYLSDMNALPAVGSDPMADMNTMPEPVQQQGQ